MKNLLGDERLKSTIHIATVAIVIFAVLVYAIG
jgi:hypothetical protein